jgi:sarcosine oxidase delta subunit
MANNAVEAGIYSVWTALSTGKLKVFSSCVKFFDEFNLYHRNEKGAIVKTNDHLMDCMRYLWNTRDKADFEISKTINTEEFYQVSLHNRTSI